MFKNVSVFLLVCMFSLQGGIGFAADTNFSGLNIDPSSDPDDTATTIVVTFQDVSSANTVTVDGAGDTKFLETGGVTGDADFQVSGYAEFDGNLIMNTGNTVSVQANSNLDIGNGNFFVVYGGLNTEIKNIETTDTWVGRSVILDFQGIDTIEVGDSLGDGNLRLSSSLSANMDDTLSLYSFDGVSWHETARSVN